MKTISGPVPIIQRYPNSIHQAEFKTASAEPYFEITHFNDGEISENYFDNAMRKFGKPFNSPEKAFASEMFLTAALAWIMLASPQAAFAADLSAGEQIFSGNCAACHAGGNNVIQSEKTLQKDALVEYLTGGFSEKSIITQVTNGKNAMPAFGGRLADDEI